MDNGLPVTAGGVGHAQPAARGGLPAVRLRLCHRQHAGAARLQAARRHRGGHARRRARRPQARDVVADRRAAGGAGAAAGAGDQAAIIALARARRRSPPERLDELAALAAAVSGDAGHSAPPSRAACSASPSGCWDADDDAAAVRAAVRGGVGRARALLDRIGAPAMGIVGVRPPQVSGAEWRRSTGGRASTCAGAARAYPAYLVDRLERLTADAHQADLPAPRSRRSEGNG